MKKLLTYDVSDWRERFPLGVISLICTFYIIGILTYKSGSLPTINFDKFLIRNNVITEFALLPNPYEFQWRFFTYSLIHFGIIHYIYTCGLLLYYVHGLERATSSKFVIFSFYIISVLSPLLLGIFATTMIYLFPVTKNYFLVANYFFGSSVAIWGLMGLTTPISYKRRFFFIIMFLLLGPEIFLKFVEGRTDILTNISHILIYVLCTVFSYLFIEFEHNTGDIGRLEPNFNDDVWLKVLLMIHAIGLIIHFLQITGYIPTTL